MLKGINQWCFPKGTPLEKVLATSQKAGFDTIELNLYDSGGVGLTMDTTPAEAKAIGDMAAGYGLKLSSLSTEMLGKNPLSSSDVAVRERGKRSILKQIELASALGIDTILVIPGRVNEQTSYDDCYKRSQSNLFEVLPEAEAHGVYMAVENVWNRFLWTPLEMSKYIDEFNSPNVCVYFDVGNTLYFGYPQHWIPILGKRIKKVHVKDYKVNVGNYNGFVPLLAGDVNWAEVRSALLEIGYDDALTAEVDPYSSYPDQLIYDTARHIDIIINREPK